MRKTDVLFSLTAKQASVIRVILYYEIFEYPLTRAEIFGFSRYEKYERKGFEEDIKELIAECMVYENQGFLFISGDESWILRRRAGNRLADQHAERAGKSARLIAKFPFIRAVYISGSFSKNYMDAQSDVDFFIVTQPGRLWLARTLLILYKKVVLLNSRRFFCLNYFIDEENLEIREKNIFTAMELTTLIPMCNKDAYQQLMQRNAWVRSYFPFAEREPDFPEAPASSAVSRTVEMLTKGWAGLQLDKFCLFITLWFWRQKYRRFSDAEFKVSFTSNRFISKHHPNRFQEKVLSQLQMRISQLNLRYGVNLEELL